MQKNKICKRCGTIKTLENTYSNGRNESGMAAYCRSCEKEYQRNRRLMNKPKKRSVVTKQWVKSNKNHYPDPEFVWQQIENSVTGTLLSDALEKKYELKKHGNTGNPGNRWINDKDKNKNK